MMRNKGIGRQNISKHGKDCLQCHFLSGLPNGLFSNQKSQFGEIFRALDWKMLIYFMSIWNN
jgi:hypothetical protein